MARFYGVIGYTNTTETAPGIWEEGNSIERSYYGDILKVNKRNQQTGNVNDDITTNTSISIVADAYANENFAAIKYVVWNGVKWKITSVDVQKPRLILALGGVYNGK